MLRKFKVKLNDKEYLVEMEELGVSGAPAPAPAPVAAAPAPVAAPAPAPAAPAAPVAAPSGSGTTVESPMPGTIWKIVANVGDTVKENDPVLILEAMKMQNEIVAPKSGKISAIYVSESAAIDVGAPMFTIE